MDFYEKAGKMALGSRLRRLSESMTEQASAVYDLYHIDLQPKWFPVYYALSAGEEKSITQIAQEIGQSHPSVSKIVKEMLKSGLVEKVNNKTDLRTNFIRLATKGIAINEKIKVQYVDVNNAVEKALNETQYNIWKAIGEWEFLLQQKDLITRVRDEKKLREIQDIEVVEYKPDHQQAFKQLNETWITAYFKMEEADHKSLNHPEAYILEKGGYILIALYKGQPVGTCALIKESDEVFELAKMAVSADAQGKGIGYVLGKGAIEKAKQAGAKKVRLESNTRLKPAINLYQKLGFKQFTGLPSAYERCNIRMELCF
jgi:DNA-binding MarR family transcriptional regulator/GNAT superfamily N-acetyltransferase